MTRPAPSVAISPRRSIAVNRVQGDEDRVPSEGMTEAPSLSPNDLAEVAAGLRRLLDLIAGGDLTADSGTVARIEGAAAAIEALSGRPIELHTTGD